MPKVVSIRLGRGLYFLFFGGGGGGGVYPVDICDLCLSFETVMKIISKSPSRHVIRI